MPGCEEGKERGVRLYGGHDDRKRRDENEDGLIRSHIPDDGENILIMKGHDLKLLSSILLLLLLT